MTCTLHMHACPKQKFQVHLSPSSWVDILPNLEHWLRAGDGLQRHQGGRSDWQATNRRAIWFCAHARRRNNWRTRCRAHRYQDECNYGRTCRCRDSWAGTARVTFSGVPAAGVPSAAGAPSAPAANFAADGAARLDAAAEFSAKSQSTACHANTCFDITAAGTSGARCGLLCGPGVHWTHASDAAAQPTAAGNHCRNNGAGASAAEPVAAGLSSGEVIVKSHICIAAAAPTAAAAASAAAAAAWQALSRARTERSAWAGFQLSASVM